MNIWAVPSTPDNNPAMSHLGMIAQFTLPILSIVSYVGLRRTDWSIDKWMERGNRCNYYTRCMLLSNKRSICFVPRIDTVLLQRNYHFSILWQRKNSGYGLKESSESLCYCCCTISRHVMLCHVSKRFSFSYFWKNRKLRRTMIIENITNINKNII